MMNHQHDVERIEDEGSGFISDSKVAKEEKMALAPKSDFDTGTARRTDPCNPSRYPTTPASAQYPHGEINDPCHPPPITDHMPWPDAIANPTPSPPYPQQPSHLLHFFETQMRDHAAAFANAAAGAAWVSAQIAADMASASTTTNAMHYPVAPQFLPRPPYMFQNVPMMQPYLVPQNSPTQFVGFDGQLQPENNFYGIHEDDAFENSSSSECMHRRRKRQQCGPPSAIPSSSSENASLSYLSPVTGPSGRRRRRARNNRSSHSESQPSCHNTRSRRRNRRVALTSSGSDGGNAYNITKKKQRQPEPDNSSLLGKTGVAALYVFCEKRRTTPHFKLKDRSDERIGPTVGGEDFEIVVSVDGRVFGHGQGKNKSGAKQEAARLALQTLLPGVEFDKASGILINLPEASVSRKSVQNLWSQREAATTAEELAPNLAKLLAIGRENERDDQASWVATADAEKTHGLHRRKNMYPETSTTSEEENEDTYYASRGASVCSALLHAMVQIDEKIPEPPVYTYHVSAVGPPLRHKHHLKRKAGGPLCTTSVIHRGSFNCTGTMSVEISNPDPGKPSFDILQAIGIGGTKREARHRAAAKLLAMLFPECEGMVAVKQAAEAFREKYAADKALKQQSKRHRPYVDISCSSRQTLIPYSDLKTEGQRGYQFALATNGPAFSAAGDHILCALQCTTQKDELNAFFSVGPSQSRQQSRQEQLDSAVSLALQKLNEHDEDGRTLPDELTVDDVGRTVLRRSTLADVHWIMNLIEGDGQLLSLFSPLRRKLNSPKRTAVESGEINISLLRHWLSSSVVLLLCRAIAPFEDPPLGCAALTMGFSMEKGCSLQITQIASKSHLPRERFIEVLQSFSQEMSSILEFPKQTRSAAATKIRRNDIEDIIQSHLLIPERPTNARRQKKSVCQVLKKTVSQVSKQDEQEHLLSTRLQSVQEEIEDCGDCSGLEFASEKRNSKQGQVKSSKRSRVQ
ncbi:unnamed protein product [Cylindrotheca closterium]|uniref:DRBM domain-containing protein n=1 Tax=Cylindrotheca closterium TaxID=2856 RepID=A0AAD2PW65_9STRA|nr:unnamed protein product [Cylindrotheca closterium]